MHQDRCPVYYLGIWQLICFFLVSPALATVFHPLDSDIQEPEGIYYPEPPDLLEVHVQTVIRSGPCEVGDYSGCTLDDVNNDTDPYDDFKPEIKVHFTADDFPDDDQVSNATLRQRGKTSREAEQKSYRLKLDSKKALWRGERRLQLNKHPYDLTRVRNKLSFDLIRNIPHLPSLRTQFVHLFIDDQDYGLFTHVEHVGKEYLARRDWDTDSPVYKAEDFDFYLYDNFALDSDGKPVDKDAFEALLEIKRGKDHRKFMEMMTALNDEDNDFMSDVFNRYFNRNNYLTWLAVNILMGNYDTSVSNFYLFNPRGSDFFYLLPWDYDDDWGTYRQPADIAYGTELARYQMGIANYWGSLLHQRFLSEPGALRLIKRAVREVKRKFLKKRQIQAHLDEYHDLVYPLISQEPDIYNLPVVHWDSDDAILEEYDMVYDDLANWVRRNYNNFLKTLDDPMPIWMEDPVFENGRVHFRWDESEDLQGDALYYDLEIATGPSFASGSIIYRATHLEMTSHQLAWTFPAGTYYFRVLVRQADDPQRHWQEPLNDIEVDGHYYPGRSSFLAPDGTGGGGTVIIVDGQENDWQAEPVYGDNQENIRPIDLRYVRFFRDQQMFYLAWRNWFPIDPDRLWLWDLYIDADGDPETGYRYGPVGAEYLLQGAWLYRYSGSGTNWQWDFITTVTRALQGDFVEFALPLSVTGDLGNCRLLFDGNNEQDGTGDPDDLFYLDTVTGATDAY